MKSAIRRIAAIVLLLCLIPACAPALTGQNISTFEAYYKEDIAYINSNTGRHLLPKDLAELSINGGGRTQYYYYDDALQVTLVADAEGIIESCEIRLLIPKGTSYGNSLHRDFTTAGYHTYAMIMAMHVSSEPASRYLLVQEISSALEDNFGSYERQLGSYTITCTRVIGEGAVFNFTNNGLAPQATETPAGETPGEADPDGATQEPDDIIEEDQGANLG